MRTPQLAGGFPPPVPRMPSPRGAADFYRRPAVTVAPKPTTDAARSATTDTDH